MNARRHGIGELFEGPPILLSEMIESTPSCLKVLSRDGALLKMNARGLDLIEADDFESVAGASVYDLVEPTHRARFRRFNEAICAGERGEMVFEIVGLKGTRRWMETYAAPYRLPNGEYAHIAITNDITEKVETERALKRQQEALAEASRLASLGQFVSGIAHEINNPLSVISGNASYLLALLALLEMEQADREELMSALRLIDVTAHGISEIIQNLKTFSRISGGDKHRRFDLRGLVDRVISLCAEKFRLHQIELSVDVTDGITLMGDEVLLSQVIMNLLNNAFDAIVGHDGPWVRIEAEASPEHVRLRFVDSGRGIPDDIVESIMNPFFTTKDVGEGTGLGLSISAGTMADHGGGLFYDEVDGHTSFTMEFPRPSARP